jgi:RHS repeat-associated protein
VPRLSEVPRQTQMTQLSLSGCIGNSPIDRLAPVFEASYGYSEEVDGSTSNDMPLRDRATITHYTSTNRFQTSSTINSSWNYVEKYRYDPQLDFLTQASYDGGASWRTWTYDNLNRMTASPGSTYTNDVVGNRLWKDYGTGSVHKYKWDVLNRLESTAGLATGSGAAYEYRGDGMRVKKVDGLSLQWIDDEEEKSGYYDEIWATNNSTWRYLHDGQMQVEEDWTRLIDGVTRVDVTKYGIGARGIDWMSKKPWNAAEIVGFPIYDGHGSMCLTAGRNGSGFGVADQRAYEVWGGVRGGSTTGDPKQRYCADLGHMQDDESGLIYMRARYYETWTGRFLTEDPIVDGWNWYSYVASNPVLSVDPTGLMLLNLLGGGKDVMDAEAQSAENALFFKKITENTLRRLINQGGISKTKAYDFIHKLKKAEGLGAADDLFFDFAKQIVGCIEGNGYRAIGSLAQLIRDFLETGGF